MKDNPQNTKNDTPYPFDFSIVMAVYNVEDFLSDAIESVLSQDIGFDRIQLILVNDGSTDSSGNICNNYARAYPHNILAVHKKNGGVASARNEGLKYATGRYINFMDSDDKFSPEAFRKVFGFLSKNQFVDIATIPLYYFDAFVGEHWQNTKFAQGTRVIDLMEEYTATIMFVNASFFRYETKENIEFDNRLVCGEDQKVLFTILARTMKLGVVTGCCYYYRRRSTGEASLIGSKENKYGWYFDYFTYLFDWARSYFEEKYSTIPPFVQHQLMCDLQWRFKEDYSEKMNRVLSVNEIELYKERLFGSLSHIDDKHIIEMRMLPVEYKLYILEKKYGKKPELIEDNGVLNLSLKGNNLLALSQHACFLDFLNITDDCKLEIEGHFLLSGLPKSDISFGFCVNNGPISQCNIFLRPELSKHCFGEVILEGYGFKGAVDLTNHGKQQIKFIQTIRGVAVEKKKIRHTRFFPVANKFKYDYYYKNGYAVTAKNHTINVTPCNIKGLLSREKRFIKEIRNLPNEEYVAILPFRKNVFKKNILPGKKKTWIISDRVNAAGDNGEALFEFLCKNPIKNINVYFVINKNSPDWNRLKKLGPVVDSGSVKHKNLLTKADLIISSHIEDAFFNPFGCSFDLLKGLMKYKFVFLQHGITKDDLSSWLNRFNKNISLFVTSAEREKQSIVNNSAYYYSEDIVKRLGFPRHDKLLTRSSNSSKRILIAPTWRTGLVTPTNPATGLKRPRDDFEKSDFFSFYSSLLNNNKLRKAAVNLGYAIDFFIHPCMIQEVTKFKSDFVNILTQGDYSTLLKTSAIMLTDYSSVAFDFAILKKPIVYTQFDRDTFFDSQIYNQGYFNYDTDAFGPICLTVEETVDKLIYYMKNPVLESKYLERINDFFIFPIEGSNKRIVDALLSL